MKAEHVGRQLRALTRFGLSVALLIACCGLASAQHWIAITQAFPGSAGTAILRTDGVVMVEDNNTGDWYGLFPDLSGSYQLGTWEKLGSPLSAYNPLYFASAVLPDSRVVISGGEYDNGIQDDTTLGQIYSVTGNKFGKLNPPTGWTQIGDASSVVLPNGTLMIADCCSPQEALLNASTLKWSTTGSGKADSNSEEGWTLLPNGKVLTVDTQNGKHAELYDPSTGTWSLTGSTPSFLGNSCGMAIVPEMGPAILRPDGTVFQAGATNKTAIYNPSSGQWTAGPSFPQGFGVADGPAALLPDGNVLVQASSISPCFKPPSKFYEFNGTSLIAAPNPPHAASDASYTGRMVILPNGGHVLVTDGSSDVEVYVPKGSAKAGWLPHITSAPAKVTRGAASTVKGTQFNGLSQGAAYGDDAQSATNFPLVRITNIATGHVYYALTKNFSTMAVATGGTIVSAQFLPPTSMETGAATLEVVTNGLASNSVMVTVM